MGDLTTEIQSTAEFDGIVKALGATQLLVIDFHAVWCGPCKFIAPVIEKLAEKYDEVKFVKIDVDKQRELAQRYKVSAMPTFKFLKGGVVVDELRGADARKLAALVQQHSGRDPNAPDTAPLDIDAIAPPQQGPNIRQWVLLAFFLYYVYKWWTGK
ncbi:Peptide-N(4)-(N-acetyl-beta-glucosaminyl)asparagine amidase [Vanrija pseudolonga]|uniref:Thioredoxin n=1 Tax=Vanrija pseudolonga TaxID=143232 RepID=A0AAF1BQS7_9TREE|nr:Peptide-N(4)-(N-acetyl-beta-glucosaminyl)asparagine amidase [Vanrija pseudolonga]